MSRKRSRRLLSVRRSFRIVYRAFVLGSSLATAGVLANFAAIESPFALPATRGGAWLEHRYRKGETEGSVKASWLGSLQHSSHDVESNHGSEASSSRPQALAESRPACSRHPTLVALNRPGLLRAVEPEFQSRPTGFADHAMHMRALAD